MNSHSAVPWWWTVVTCVECSRVLSAVLFLWPGTLREVESMTAALSQQVHSLLAGTQGRRSGRLADSRNQHGCVAQSAVSARRAVRCAVLHLCALCGLTQCCAVVVDSGHVCGVFTCLVCCPFLWPGTLREVESMTAALSQQVHSLP